MTLTRNCSFHAAFTGRKAGAVERCVGIGWEFVHVCIDDVSRVAFV